MCIYCITFSWSFFITYYVQNLSSLFFLQAKDVIRDFPVTGVQTCALPLENVGWRRGQIAIRLRVEPDRQQAAEGRQDLVEPVPEEHRQPGPEPGPDGHLGLALVHLQPPPEHLDERPVQEVTAVGQAPP